MSRKRTRNGCAWSWIRGFCDVIFGELISLKLSSLFQGFPAVWRACNFELLESGNDSVDINLSGSKLSSEQDGMISTAKNWLHDSTYGFDQSSLDPKCSHDTTTPTVTPSPTLCLVNQPLPLTYSVLYVAV